MHEKFLKVYFFLIATVLLSTWAPSAFAYDTVKVARAKDKTEAQLTVAVEENSELADCRIYFASRDSADTFILEQNSNATADLMVAEETDKSAADIRVAEENIARWADVRVYGTSDIVLAAAACKSKQ